MAALRAQLYPGSRIKGRIKKCRKQLFPGILKPTPIPYRSALFVPVVSAGGAFGLASAAEVTVLLNTLNAVIAALNSREITALP
jgi:hypothetical protein